MANTVTIGMLWQEFGKKEVDLPDTIDVTGPNARKEIMDYLNQIKDTITLPEGEYLPDSDVFDTETPLEIKQDNSRKGLPDRYFELEMND